MSKIKPGEDIARYEVITQEDENGDLIIPIPPMLLKQLGWKEGDDIEFNKDDQGRYILSKSSK
jgi:bifunctional DNA-binding transcriptional regulator/antitoxin component of YhaV-PrlF toxin-antitoxin module